MDTKTQAKPIPRGLFDFMVIPRALFKAFKGDIQTAVVLHTLTQSSDPWQKIRDGLGLTSGKFQSSINKLVALGLIERVYVSPPCAHRSATKVNYVVDHNKMWEYVMEEAR